MTNTSSLAAGFIKELEAEAVSTHKCLEKIPESAFDYKPHPTSMTLGYLSQLVAEIPLWIAYMIEKGEIDLATFHNEIKTDKKLVDFFDDNMNRAKNALQQASEASFSKVFYLKTSGKTVFSATTADYIGPTINLWVHHRGQLTVYMRMKEIPVPAIYGPSGDDKNF